jgi:hypothetical protein
MTKQEFLEASNLTETPLLYYVSGYKYQSRNDMVFQVFIYPDQDIITDLIVLRKDGWLWVSAYFAWDGCSGLTWDDSTNMCAGLCHDALYALMRMGLLPLYLRYKADYQLKRIMLRDGAVKLRAGYYEYAVNTFAGAAARPESAKKMIVAPKRIKMDGSAPA